MPDLLLELLSEEIPARMQAKARTDLARLLTEQLAAAGLKADAIETYATPRRLALIARGLPLGTPAVSEELKGPRSSAPPQALEGFLRKTGLTQDQLEDRGGIWFARIEKPGRATTDVLADAIPAIVRAFPWPKSMRWGAASITTESPRWVRPLQGIVAMLDEELIDFEIGDVRSSAATIGHRFHHPGRITLAGASDYLEKLRACHVIVDQDERAQIIREGAAALAAEAGLTLVPDEGLVLENAGLTEWPVPLLGRFDEAFLEVPREVIQLTMRTNQKYFACVRAPAKAGALAAEAPDGSSPALRPSPEHAGGDLAPAFICVANIAATDGGTRIVAGNQKVLAARLSDARFFWEQDLKIPLEQQAAKLSQIVFHEKLGTVADKVDRVAKLARWLVEEGIVTSSPSRLREGLGEGLSAGPLDQTVPPPTPPASGRGELAALAERAARLCKADLVTQMVGEFPELQGLIGGYLAAAQGEDPQVASAIRDHYKPVGQGDAVPTDLVTVAVSLADKLDTLVAFFAAGEQPTGSKDPYAIRRATLAVLSLIQANSLRVSMIPALSRAADPVLDDLLEEPYRSAYKAEELVQHGFNSREPFLKNPAEVMGAGAYFRTNVLLGLPSLGGFFADRLKVQQREAGVRHDLIDAVFALGGEDDLVRLLARVRALQAFVETPEGADLLAGYKRAANILKKEGWGQTSSAAQAEAQESAPLDPGLRRGAADFDPVPLSYAPEPAETALVAALDSAEPAAAAAIEQEDFQGAMRALATLRSPVDAFFTEVTVNDPDQDKRAARLDLLARMRDAVHRVADFSRIEG
jgi:glycyl-tRNA synthetase beta chain